MRIKKAIIIILIIIMALNFFIVDAAPVLPCGPSVPTFCEAGGNCGLKECTATYKLIETPASTACFSEYAACSIIPEPAERQACQQAAVVKYTAAEASAEAAGNAFKTGILNSGLFEQVVPCVEMTNCINKIGSISNFQSFNRLQDCDGSISDQMKKKILDNPPASKWETFLENTANNNELIKPGKQLSPKNLAERIKTGGLSNEMLDKTITKTLADASVRDAMAGAQRKLTFLKQAAVWKEVIMGNKVVKYALLGKEVFGIASMGVGFLDGGPEDVGNLQAAQSAIDDSPDTVASAGFLSQTFVCDDIRAAQCLGPECFMDLIGGASQCGATLQPDDIISFASIHIFSPSQNNLYTLTGFGNKGIIYEEDGFINIHEGGTTKIAVAGEGAAISDMKGNRFLLKGGIMTYTGIGTDNIDTYIGNTATVHLNSMTAFDATEDRGGNVFGTISLPVPTGAVSASPSDSNLAISFNHYTSPDFKNAVDLGSTGSGYQIIAKGFGDIILLGKEKLFPLLSRNVLKGDSAIIFNKDVKVINSYAARDHTYLYNIKSDGISTKVRARGKIIQDSAGLKREFTSRQRDLVYR